MEIENSGLKDNTDLIPENPPNIDIYDELDACSHNRNLRFIPFHFRNDINDLLDKNHTPYEEKCLVCQSLFISLTNKNKNENKNDKELNLNGE